MGFDLYAKKGSRFRNTVWYWYPLWEYIGHTCGDILTHEDLEQGTWNNGYGITKDKAADLAERLEELLLEGEVAEHEESYNRHINSLPLKKCLYCDGTGTRNDEYVQGCCNGCNGKGRSKQNAVHYPFTKENVREFAAFCRDSGGFAIY